MTLIKKLLLKVTGMLLWTYKFFFFLTNKNIMQTDQYFNTVLLKNIKKTDNVNSIYILYSVLNLWHDLSTLQKKFKAALMNT